MSAPHVPRVDAHIHLWDPELLSYPWLDALPSLQRKFALGDFPGLAADAAHAVDAVIAVEANVAGGIGIAEANLLDRYAREEPRLVGIVAYVNVPEVSPCIRALEQLRRSHRVVGVRHNIQGHPPGYATHRNFVAGVKLVGEKDFPFDLCITAAQLAEVTTLVQRCPSVCFILDHCGKPNIASGGFEEWRRGIDALAAHPSVYCKLSGLFTEAGPGRCNVESLRPYLKHVIETFGPRRVMYASDWPVCTLAGSADDWHALVNDVVGGLCSRHERDEIFGGTAIRAYRLSIPAPA